MLKTYWMEPTGSVRVLLHRSSEKRCRATGHTCEATLMAEREGQASRWLAPELVGAHVGATKAVPQDDPRWPTVCSKCGEPLPADAEHHLIIDRLYSGSPDGRLLTIGEFKPGATWDAFWMPEHMKGPDGISMMCILPNGLPWLVDGKASNCTRPKDKKHRCWVREGDPRKANVTAGKKGDTCSAGAGSIQAGNYHGFLRNGILT